MSRFQLRELRVDNYRCFGELKLPLEEDTTILFAENGGGKTALLTALAMGLAVIQRDSPKTLKLKAGRDSRRGVPNDKGAPEPVGPCEVSWTAAVGDAETVTWSTAVQPVSGRTRHRHRHRHRQIFEAVEQVRVPGVRWPLFAWYGVDRLERLHDRSRKVELTRDRWEAYASALDPNLDEAPLLQWLQDEFLGDTARRQQKLPERFFHAAVMEAAVRATPGVKHAWYDAVEKNPVMRFEDGHLAPWSDLSDGYHVFIALVADIARRAVMLNEFDGAAAPARGGGRGAHRRARPPPPPTMAARGATAPSRRVPATTVHHHHALTAGTQQRPEPSGAAPRRRRDSGPECVRVGPRHQRDPPRSDAH